MLLAISQSGCFKELKAQRPQNEVVATSASPSSRPAGSVPVNTARSDGRSGLTTPPDTTPSTGPGIGSPPTPSQNGLFEYSAPDSGIDLRKYFPSQYTRNLSRKSDGSLYSDYRMYRAAPSLGSSFLQLFSMFFDQGKSGQLRIWEKRYFPDNELCVKTYAQLFFGDDMSVTEVGDWYADVPKCTPDVAFGYGGPGGENSGLAWSSSGGLSTQQSQNPSARSTLRTNLSIRRQASPGAMYTDYGPSGYKAWSETRVLETLASFTPEYGRSNAGVWGTGFGKSYKNVVRIVFYHGTQTPGQSGISCVPKSNGSLAALYRHQPGYNTYASEYYLAPDIGIIQETFLYVEDASYWGGIANCSGVALDSDSNAAKRVWTSYIDN